MTSDAIVAPSLTAQFRKTAKEFAQNVVIRFAGRTLTFGEFDAQSDRVAAGLTQRGIAPGERVALYCTNSDFFALAYVGIIKAGATVVPLNLMLNPREVEYILNDCQVWGLVYHAAMQEAVAAFRLQVPTLSLAVCVGGQASNVADVSWAQLLENDGHTAKVAVNPAEDVAAIIYTSGTTGKPKGAMLTHRNLLANTASVKQALQVQSGEDVMLVVLPMFHAFAATVGMLTPLLHGGGFVPVPKFEPDLVLNAIVEGGATIFLGVPSMYNVLMSANDAQVAKFSSIRYCVSGGAAMPQALMRRFEDRFGKAIYEGDGPTECSPVTCVNPIGGLRKPASVGLPLPQVEMAIFDSNGHPVPNNQLNEICVRGPNVMKGYWNRAEETRESFFGDWFRTGDLGYRDDDGYFFMVDRIKDMVIVNGMNVYPRVIEEVLYQHPAVKEAAVVGEPNELHGEIPVAFVVLQAASEVSGAELRKFCAEHVGRHEVPRKVFFLDALPKNAAGKVLKRELRKHGELERGVDTRR